VPCEYSEYPVGYLAGLTALRQLFLYRNQLTAVPELPPAGAGALQELDVSKNRNSIQSRNHRPDKIGCEC
jgi:hypothetical protein